MMNMMSLLLVAVVAFTYFGGQNVPKVLKDNKQMVLGVFVGVLLHRFMGGGVEGMEDPCDCATDECLNNNVISCRSDSRLCSKALPGKKNLGGVRPDVDSNLPDFRCALSRYEALLCGGENCLPKSKKDYTDLGGKGEDQCWDDNDNPSNQLNGFSGGLTLENISAATADIQAKSRLITDTSAKNYGICVLNRMIEMLDTSLPPEAIDARHVYLDHLNGAISNLSKLK
jgi:hypothetical protein